MRPLSAFVIALVLASAQAALLRWFGGGAVSLALALPIVVYLGLHAGNVDGAVGAAAVGYVVDLMSGGPKGLMTFLAVALFLYSRLAGAALAVQGRVGFAFLFGALALVFTRAVSTDESAPGLVLVGRVAVEALLTAACSPFIDVVMRRIDA